MPKAKRNANISRVVRRRLAAAENLPSPATRKSEKTVGEAHVDDSSTIKEELSKKGNIDSAEKKASGKISDEPGVPATQQLSRGQRKRLAKREQFLKKEKMILSSLLLKRKEEQKKRIDGLDAIKQALMDTSSTAVADDKVTPPEVKHVTTNKAKQKLVAKEVEHMNLILQHPAFKKDPFETMQEHLRNTFAADKKQQEILSKRRSDKEKRKSEAKRAEKEGVKKKTQKKKYKPRRTR